MRRTTFFLLFSIAACSGDDAGSGTDGGSGTETSSSTTAGSGGTSSSSTGTMTGASSTTGTGTTGTTDGTAGSGGTTAASTGAATTTGGSSGTTGGVACAVTVFVNFDGVTLTKGTDDATTDTSSIADGTFAPYAGTIPAEDVFAAFEAIFAPYPVCATDVRPDAGPYAMVVVTADTSPYGPGVGELAGIDCGDGNPKSVALVFENGSVDTAAGIAARIAHAFAHTLGLEHVDEPSDVLNVSSPGTSFVDACSDLVGPQDPVCGAQHEAFCPPGQQNGQAELSALGG